jgi:hypothetical protein
MFTQYAKDRMEICRGCEHYRAMTKQCMVCGCFMPAKTSFKDQECPLDPPKWGKIIESRYAPSTPGCCGQVR